MKKYALLMAAAMMICTLAGCGEKETAGTSQEQTSSTDITDTTNSASGSNDTENAAGGNAGSADGEIDAPITESLQQPESTTTTASEVVSVPEEVEVFVPVIKDEGEYKNGSWLFEAADSEGEIKSYLYNATADELIEFTPEERIVDFSGFTVVYHSYERTYAKNIKTDEIYFDTNNNEHVIRSEDIWGKDKDYFVDNTLLVLQKETGFDKGGVWMGVVRDDGTWDFEMRADYQVPYHSDYDRLIWKYYGNGVVSNSEQMFIIDTNEYLDYKMLENIGILYTDWGFSDAQVLYANDDVVYVNLYDVTKGRLVGYNKKTKSIIYHRDCESDFGNAKPWGDLCLLDYRSSMSMEGKCVVCNMETGEEITFDTTNYDTVFVQALSENAILFECQGADGNMYLCTINTNGDRIMEPTLKSELTYLCTTSDGNFVLKTNDGKIRTIDTTAGEVTDTEASYTDIIAEEGSDIAVVEVHDPETAATSYKLVDLKDPATVIDPFAE